MNKTALITGGTGGIGQALCREFAENGYHVIINYAHADQKARALAAKTGGELAKFDVGDVSAVQTAVEKITAEYGRIDVLINNAGVSEIGLFTHIPQEKYTQIMQTDLIGTMNCTRAVLPSMISRKSGNIINISSMWGQCGASCEVDYSAAKAGVIGFTKALAKEVAPSGIRVNCIAPGFIMTEMNARFTPDELEGIREEIPLGIFGEPRHIADCAAFLASGRSEYITGQVIAVNGGMVI